MNYSHTCKFREGVTIQNQNDKKVAKWSQCNSLVTHWLYRKYVSNNALVYVSLLILMHIVYCRFVLYDYYSCSVQNVPFIFNCPFLAPMFIYCNFPSLQLILVFLYSTSTNTAYMNDPK